MSVLRLVGGSAHQDIREFRLTIALVGQIVSSTPQDVHILILETC